MGGSSDDEDVDLHALTRAVEAEDPVCHACHGRLVADRSFGLINAQRGKALRIAHALQEDNPYEPPEQAACWVCEGECTRFDIWSDRVIEAIDGIEFDTYQIGCRVPPLLEENEGLLREVAGLAVDAGEPLKGELNREVGKRVGAATGASADLERPDIVALLHLERGTVEVSINPAFVYGRYRKLERDIPQTEWPCTDCGGSGKQLGETGEEPCTGCDGTGYRYDQSVEGFTVPHVVEVMDGREGLFHGAGREDVDARMLGTGRPFVVEVKDPRRRRPDVETLETTINEAGEGIVEVDGLVLVTYEMVERVKELPASKTYRMTVEFGDPVTEASLGTAIERLNGATIEQRTPRRVRHRRSDLMRTRQVYACVGERVNETTAEIEVHGEGGLYVKELISGDDGGTKPSLAGELGIEAHVRTLDVMSVNGEDEPFVQSSHLLE